MLQDTFVWLFYGAVLHTDKLLRGIPTVVYCGLVLFFLSGFGRRVQLFLRVRF